MQRRLRRNKLEIFYDILSSLDAEIHNGNVKPTRVQQRSNLSYDKFSKHLKELEGRKLVTNAPTLKITKNGGEFLQDYKKINNFIMKMKLDYLIEGGDSPHEF